MLGAERRLGTRTRRVAYDRRTGLQHRRRPARGLAKLALIDTLLAKLGVAVADRLDVASVGAASGLDPRGGGEIRSSVAAVGALRRLELGPRVVVRAVAALLASGLLLLTRFLPVLAGRLAFFARRIAIRRAMGRCERGRCECARKQQ
jgi:hypothetical protein